MLQLTKHLTTFLCYTCFLFHLSAQAVEIDVIFGISRPPFIMEEERTGIAYELTSEVLKRIKIPFKPQFGSTETMQKKLNAGEVDVAVEVRRNNADIYYSDRLIAYRNFAISRSADNIRMKSFSDLKGYAVCAWQGAGQQLRQNFSQARSSFKSYSEFAVQKKQVESWLLKQCDVILIDDSLLKWHMHELVPSLRQRGHIVDTNLNYDAFPGGNELWFYAGFRSRILRNRFNDALSSVLDDGTYYRIREQFLHQINQASTNQLSTNQ